MKSLVCCYVSEILAVHSQSMAGISVDLLLKGAEEEECTAFSV